MINDKEIVKKCVSELKELQKKTEEKRNKYARESLQSIATDLCLLSLETGIGWLEDLDFNPEDEADVDFVSECFFAINLMTNVLSKDIESNKKFGEQFKKEINEFIEKILSVGNDIERLSS